MVAKEFLVDLNQVDMENIIADRDDIARLNPQRFEMEQLSAVVYIDEENMTVVGYKDITEDEFWVRGHMPNMPLMPGVMQLEAAAQLCSFICQRLDVVGADMVGFGGLDNTRFRESVLPGDRLILICKLTKVRRGRMVVCDFQGIVNGEIAVEGTLRGISLPLSALQAAINRPK